MPEVLITCPNCSKEFRKDSASFQKTALCPSCLRDFDVSAQLVKEPDGHKATGKETKECVFCGEQILVQAKKCKHCGEFLDESARPVSMPIPQPKPAPSPQAFPRYVRVERAGLRWEVWGLVLIVAAIFTGIAGSVDGLRRVLRFHDWPIH